MLCFTCVHVSELQTTSWTPTGSHETARVQVQLVFFFAFFCIVLRMKINFTRKNIGLLVAPFQNKRTVWNQKNKRENKTRITRRFDSEFSLWGQERRTGCPLASVASVEVTDQNEEEGARLRRRESDRGRLSHVHWLTGCCYVGLQCNKVERTVEFGGFWHRTPLFTPQASPSTLSPSSQHLKMSRSPSPPPA